ncbi:formyltransferase family protein [Hydrogenimonas sp.]
MRLAVLTSPNQWFVPYARRLAEEIGAELLFDHEAIEEGYDILFILSYHRILPASVQAKNRHNVVVHASDLPRGKGWAPMFWQILEGKNAIPFTMFEASDGVDAGPIYMKRTLHLEGHELNPELRHKQATFTMAMCRAFLEDYERLKEPSPQRGEESFYPRRSPADSRLDPDRTIREQFNLLRIVDNEAYPAFFEIDGHRYILKIEKEES